MHIFIYSRKNKANDYLIKSKHVLHKEKNKNKNLDILFTIENRTTLIGI